MNRKLNRWYDHGLGKGGNLIDLGIEYYHCTIGELLDKLSGSFSFQKPVILHPEIVNKPEQRIKILEDLPLTSFALLRYLEQRHIPLEIAEKYCREVRYELNGKTWYGIGFKNNSGGYEIRNPYFKGSSSPKDITTFKNGLEEASVFEGFIDFLSFRVLNKNLSESSQDYVVLNSKCTAFEPLVKQDKTAGFPPEQFARVRFLLMKIKTSPLRGPCPKRPLTRPHSPSKLFRMSVGSRNR